VEQSLRSSFTDRIVGAAKLDVHLYEEVEGDKEAMTQALGIVVLSNFAAGIGSIAGPWISTLVVGTILGLISWFVWAYLSYLIGTKVLPEPQTSATYGQLLRTVGFSSSPGLIRVLGIIPGLKWIVMAVSSVWMLIAMVIAVRQALDYKSTFRAVAVCFIGWLIQGALFVVLFSLVGKPAQ
jgi:hypothetical protein